MDIAIYNVEISGSRLLMHNSELSDPLNPYAKALKEITSKSKKSDADHLESRRREFIGGLYFDKELGPVIPADVLDAMIIEGGRKYKLGKQFSSVVRVVDPAYKLEYSGPRTKEALWKDEGFRLVKRARVNGGSSVQRTRPLFTKWKLKFQIQSVPEVVNEANLHEALRAAGLHVGIGDWRPKYGSFLVDSFKKA